MAYLRIDFGDNDFGLIVEQTLIRLWKFIRENNDDAILRSFSGNTLLEVFKILHELGYLTKMISKGLDCEYNWHQIEYATRGLYHKEIKLFEEQQKALNPLLEKISNYLIFGLSFHLDNKFSKKWNNGESACLNLRTGYCRTF